MSNLIQFPTGYFPNPDESQAIGLGYVYIGQPNTDPSIEANRVTVTIKEQDGTEVPIAPASQPLELSAGGVFVYDGSPVQVFTDVNYSMAVYDADDVLKYYFEDAGIPDIIEDIQNSTYTYLTNVAGTNTVTAEASPELTAYAVGQMFHFTPANTNTTAATLNIDTLGAGAVQLNGAALTGGELGQSKPVIVICTDDAGPTFEIASWSFTTVARTLLTQATQALMRTVGLGISAAMDAVITAATVALARVELGFSADTYLGGAWTTRAFSAGNFTANGSMTWTVGAGDVTTDKYVINGKMMTYIAVIATSTIGGTPDSAVQITIPASKTAVGTTYVQCKVDNDSNNSGYAVIAGTTISIQKNDGTDFVAGADATFVAVEATFEIA